MSRGIYLRADGRLPCYCAIGESITLGRIPLNGEAFDFVEDFYQSAPFKRIREMQLMGLTPFPGICEQCIFLDMEGKIDTALINSEVEWFQWEPSFLCMLDCQWCSGLRTKGFNPEKNHVLPFGPFRKIIDSLADRGFRLDKGNLCGYGEPTINKDVWEMVELVKKKIGGDILLSTNGNGPFSEKIITSGLTKIKIAIDGIDQAIYSRYRKHGKLDRVINFTKSIAKHKEKLHSNTPSIIWQYILFNYNDSDEDLLRFQKIAGDLGVNQIRIVHTRTSNYSSRNPEDFPKFFPDIIYSTTNQYSQMTIEEGAATWEKINNLKDNGELQKAKDEAIQFLNRLYYRLTLGIESYQDHLLFAQGLYYVGLNNFRSLDEKTFRLFKSYIINTYKFLAKLHVQLGYDEQSEKYTAYLNRIS